MNTQFSFDDFIKKSIFKLGVFEKVSALDVLFCLLVTFVVGLFIFYIYKSTFRGVVYSYTFNVTILFMCLVTSLIILTIGSNVILSLGMVGALSIVRFRTAIKDPMDVMFMFWAIAAGISCGAGIYPVALVGSLFIGFVLILMAKFNFKHKVYILLINHDIEASEEIKVILSKLKHTLKSKIASNDGIELTIEVHLKNNNSVFVDQINKLSGVKNATLVAYNGEYAI